MKEIDAINGLFFRDWLLIGCESEAAFNRAFKREFEQPPGRCCAGQKNSSTEKANAVLEKHFQRQLDLA